MTQPVKPKPKVKPKPRVVGPFESVNPPIMGEDEKKAREVRPAPPPPSNIPSPAVQRRMEEQVRDEEMAEQMDRAEEISRRSSLGTYKPEKKAKGGMVGSASKRADGCATRGKTRGKMV
jgi:hypothetical protein